QVATVLTEASLLLGAGAAQDRAQSHADREQARGFAEDQVEVFLEGNQFAEALHLEQFALDHLLSELDERVKDAEIALLDGDLESLHVEPISGEHALGVAPLGVSGGTAAAGLGFVD